MQEPQISTQRLNLRLLKKEDINYLAELHSDPEVRQFFPSGIQNRAQTQKQLNNFISYYEEKGLPSFVMFDRESGEFIGRCGFGPVETGEIEVGYLLHKKFWGQGYASEALTALLEWAQKNIDADYIIAFAPVEHIASQRVMQKCGMRFYKNDIAKGVSCSFYRIRNKNTIDYSKIKLTLASLNDYPVIQNMGRFYVYDMSEYLGSEDGWKIPDNGLYECIDFKKYWQTDEAFPFLIRYESELAGFVIIDKKGSEPGIDYNMAQFFILRKFKNKGIGRYVAHQCFDKFQGAWEVMVIPGNTGAYCFWKSIIKNYTHDNFIEYTRKVAHFNNSEKNIFKLNSKNL